VITPTGADFRRFFFVENFRLSSKGDMLIRSG
jgi:hypothetical protein